MLLNEEMSNFKEGYDKNFISIFFYYILLLYDVFVNDIVTSCGVEGGWFELVKKLIYLGG
jgi:hypothetical protein